MILKGDVSLASPSLKRLINIFERDNSYVSSKNILQTTYNNDDVKHN